LQRFENFMDGRSTLTGNELKPSGSRPQESSNSSEASRGMNCGFDVGATGNIGT